MHTQVPVQRTEVTELSRRAAAGGEDHALQMEFGYGEGFTFTATVSVLQRELGSAGLAAQGP